MSKEQDLKERFRSVPLEEKARLYRGVRDPEMKRWMGTRIKASSVRQHRRVPPAVREELGL